MGNNQALSFRRALLWPGTTTLRISKTRFSKKIMENYPDGKPSGTRHLMPTLVDNPGVRRAEPALPISANQFAGLLGRFGLKCQP
jgi:hypothetical protein